MKFKTVKNVTLPILKFGSLPLYIKINEPMFLGKIVDDKKEAPTMCRVTNLVDGSPAHLICGTVLRENLNENYPENGYVGKCFELKQSAPEGKRYKLYDITEIEIEADEPAPAATHAPEGKNKK